MQPSSTNILTSESLITQHFRVWANSSSLRKNTHIAHGFAQQFLQFGKDPVKSSKDSASLVVCTRKKFFCLGRGDVLQVTS